MNRAILRENGIAVREMAIPNKYPVLSVPFLKSVTASILSRPPTINELTVNAWDIPTGASEDWMFPTGIDEEFMSTKEYEFAYQIHDTSFYDLIIRKESKEMNKDCCGKKVEVAYKHILIGFNTISDVPKVISSWTNALGGESLALKEATRHKAMYTEFKVLALDKNFNTVYIKDVCFEPVEVKAKLC